MANLEITLEKNAEAKLDATEQGALNKLDPKVFEAQVNQIKNTKFDLSDTTKGVTLDTIVKSYNTITKKIEINGEKISVKLGSNLAAWIQILMIADKKSVAYDSSLGIDANIGKQTKNAIEHYKLDNTPKTNTIPNQPNNDLRMKTLNIDKNLISKILESIHTTNLLVQEDSKMKADFKRAKENNVLNANGCVIYERIDVTSKEYVLDYKDWKTNKGYRIPLEKILMSRKGDVDDIKLTQEVHKIILLMRNDKKEHENQEGREKEKPGLENLKKEWADLQNKATKEINAATSAATKSSKTEEYSNKYTTLINKIVNTKVKYTNAEYKKLADHIKYQKSQLDKTNIETNYPNFIKEKYATLQKNIESSNINIKWLVDSYIQDVKNISIIQNKYANRGMKRQILELDLNKLQNRLEKQKIYLTNKADLDKTYTTLFNTLDKGNPYQQGLTRRERRPKVVLMENGTYRNNNQPTTYKESFASVGKTKEYDAYVEKFKVLVI